MYETHSEFFYLENIIFIKTVLSKTIFDRELRFARDPRNSFVVCQKVLLWFAQFLEYCIMQSSCIILYQFKTIIDMFAELHQISSFLDKYRLLQNCIKSYHFRTSLDMFAELYQIASFYDKFRHVCRIVSNLIILGKFLTCLQNRIKSYHFKTILDTSAESYQILSH